MSFPERWPVRAVVFDLDGLLIDTERVFAEGAKRLLAGRGLPPDPAFMQTVMGTPGREALPRFKAHFKLDDTLETLEADYRRHFFEALAGGAQLMPGAAALLDALERHEIPKAIATSSNREYVDAVFGPYGWMGRFTFVLTADDITHGKPHPEIYLKAVQRFRLLPAEVVVLEDSPAGMRSAMAAGAKCVVVPHAATPMNVVAAADLIADRLDAPELFAKIGLTSSRS